MHNIRRYRDRMNKFKLKEQTQYFEPYQLKVDDSVSFRHIQTDEAIEGRVIQAKSRALLIETIDGLYWVQYKKVKMI